jgi:hypothetical protein
MIDKRLTISFATGGVWGKDVNIEITRAGEKWTDVRTTNEYTVSPQLAQRLAKKINLHSLLGAYEMTTHLHFGEGGEVSPSVDITRESPVYIR